MFLMVIFGSNLALIHCEFVLSNLDIVKLTRNPGHPTALDS